LLSAHLLLFWTTMFALGLGSGCTAGFGALLAELCALVDPAGRPA